MADASDPDATPGADATLTAGTSTSDDRGSDDASATFDVIIVGAGVAGLTAALGLAGAHGRRVAVVTKTATLVGGSSVYAQGGLAAAVGEGDTPAEHAADTISVAGGIAVPDVVKALTAEGPGVVARLLALGTPFDRDADGTLLLGREAAHSQRRILHADGDATGGAIVRTLAGAVLEAPGVDERTEHAAFALQVEAGAVVGVRVVGPSGRVTTLRAPAVVLATGGIGHLFANTTNPPENTGDGLAMAARAGAVLADLEFVQFHPTALAAPGADPLPLLTEALRGEGAVLVDERDRRFLVDEHPLAELAPRDVVARSIWRQLAEGHTVYVDARTAVGDRFPTRFPTVFRLCRAYGLDPRRERIPVAPAAHYHMGGIAVDGRGRTSMPGLWACGEVTSTGVHGANRLASNSLLEAIAFGGHVADDIAGGGAGPWPTRATFDPAFDPASSDHVVARTPLTIADPTDTTDVDARTARIRQTAWDDVGLVRDAVGLRAAERAFSAAEAALAYDGAITVGAIEARNLALVGRLVAQAASAREESRGAHYRSDFPLPDDARWARRQFVVLASGDGVR